MISTQKLIIMVVSMNMVFGMISLMTNLDGENIGSSDLTNILSTRGANFTDEMRDLDEFEGTRDAGFQQETTTLSSQSSTSLLWNFLKGGVNPNSLSGVRAGYSDSVISLMIIDFVTLIRVLFDVILMLEFILILKNRKAT